jgi:hypothetical protein
MFQPPQKCSTSKLFFDEDNPRLATGDRISAENEAAIISTLREISDLDELIGSICANTYLDLEPLIAMPCAEGYTVLEGNRRLAVIKLIQNPDLAKKCKISLPEYISQAVYNSLNEVTIVTVNSPSEAQAFIAFKHINGPYRWDSHAKAKFVTEWYKRERENGITIDDIARHIGDEHNTVRSLVSSMLVLEQAEREKLFEIKDRYNKGRFAFSHLYTALDRKEYMQFLGLERGWDEIPADAPINQQKLGELEEVFKYLYGSKRDQEKPKVISQNPHLKHLGEVLVNPVALAKIRSPKSELSVAYQEVRPGSEVFTEALVIAHNRLKDLLAIVDKFEGEEHLLKLGQQIFDQAEALVQVMERKAARQKSKSE